MKLAFAALALVGCAGSHEMDRPVVENHPPADAARPEGPTLVPIGLEFRFLPINSVRAEVKGYDAAADLCVHVIWDFSNNKQAVAKHCDDFFAGFPYVAIERGACTGGVAYWGNLDFGSGTGCIDFGGGMGTTHFVDATLKVRGELFTGTIKLKSPRSSATPRLSRPAS